MDTRRRNGTSGCTDARRGPVSDGGGQRHCEAQFREAEGQHRQKGRMMLRFHSCVKYLLNRVRARKSVCRQLGYPIYRLFGGVALVEAITSLADLLRTGKAYTPLTTNITIPALLPVLTAAEVRVIRDALKASHSAPLLTEAKVVYARLQVDLAWTRARPRAACRGGRKFYPQSPQGDSVSPFE